MVQAQGARTVLRRNAAHDEDAAALLVDGNDEGDSDGTGCDDEVDMLDHGDGVSWGDGAADEAATTPRGDDADATVPISAYHLRKVPPSGIAQRQGLVSIAEALELPEDARVRACSRLSFVALFEYGWKAEQLLYTSHSFRGKPWYDLVLYSHPEDASTISVAEVRAIVRRPEGDVAVIPDIFVVPGVDNCPLVARGCTRMAGNVLAGDTDVRLRALPVACVRRVVHEVPDFADLVRRVGVHAEPAGRDAPLADRLAMRYFIDSFYPRASSE